jgi:acyl carrier protein
MDVAGPNDQASGASRTLPQLLAELAGRYPEKSAIEAPGRPIPLTYGQLADHTTRIADQPTIAQPVAVGLPQTTLGAEVVATAKPWQTRPPRPYLAPRTAVEQTVADLWREILKLDSISIDERFLDLGGDSIQAGRITSRLRALYSIELPISVLFATPTIAAIAEVIEQRTAPPHDHAEIEKFLADIENLSDAEAERLLTEEAD